MTIERTSINSSITNNSDRVTFADLPIKTYFYRSIEDYNLNRIKSMNLKLTNNSYIYPFNETVLPDSCDWTDIGDSSIVYAVKALTVTHE